VANANPEKLKVVKQQSVSGLFINGLARDAASGKLYLGGSDFKVYEVDPAAAKFERTEIGKHETWVTDVILAGKSLVSCGYDGKVIWWDVSKKAPLVSHDAHTRWARQLAATRDGKLVASVADDMVCKLWDGATGKLINELRGHKERTPTSFPSMLYACTFSADGKYLATGDKVGHIVVWETATGKQATTLESPGMYTWDGRQRIHSIGGIRSLAFSPDGKTLAVGGIGRIGNVDHLDGPARVEIFDWQSGKSTQLFDKTKFKGLVNRLHFHPQGEWLVGVGGAGNGLIAFFDLNKKKVIKEENAKFHILSMALSANGDTLHVAGHNNLAHYELKG
jgi:WD40 repeat protein